jgi:hypothetical protein
VHDLQFDYQRNQFVQRLLLTIWKDVHMLINTDFSFTYYERYMLAFLRNGLLDMRGYRETRWEAIRFTAMARVKRFLAGGEKIRLLKLEEEGSLDGDMPSVEDIEASEIELNDESMLFYRNQHSITSVHSFATCPRSMLLSHALLVGYQDMVRYLLNLSKDHQGDVYKMKEHQRFVNTAMLQVRSLSMLKYLIEEEHADVNYVDRKSGRTILAQINYHIRDAEVVAMIQYIYEQGFCQTEQIFESMYSSDRSTVLRQAIRYGNWHFLEALLYYGYGYEMSFYASIDEEDGKPTLKSTPCSNIDELRLENMTLNPLIYTVVNHREQRCNEAWIDYLLTHHKANVNAQDASGNTALIYAVQYGITELTTRLVIEFGADINLKNNAGESAYSLAQEPFKTKLSAIWVGSNFKRNM